MNRFLTKGIPIWVTIFALILFILGSFLGIMAIFGLDPNPLMTPSLGGRNMGLALVIGLAILFKNPAVYLAGFLGGILREIGDLIAEFSKVEPDMGIIVGIAAFLFISIVAAYHAYKARNI